MDESDRLLAALKGNFVAKHFPCTWYKLQQREKTMKPSLKEQVATKIKQDEERRRYGIKKTTPTKKDILELLVRIEKLIKDKDDSNPI
jgi:hypothetical protein